MFNSVLKDVLDTYANSSAKWMSTLFILATAMTCVQIVVGLCDFCSRFGSAITTLASIVAVGFISAFAIFTSLTYIAVTDAFNSSLNKSPGITFQLGRTMFTYMWAAFACSLFAALFWSFSACCCSARRSREEPSMNPKAYTYETVTEGPHGGQQHTVQTEQPGFYEQQYPRQE